jgi:predicted GNAT superfamily acetyltransferase
MEQNASLRADDLISTEDIVIEIPREITSNHEHWRVATREAFTNAIQTGYIVEDFLVSGNTGRYVLRRKN